MRVLALTRYNQSGPSSRLRFYQFVPYLKSAGFSIYIEPLLGDKYIQRLFSCGKRNVDDIIKGYINRSKILFKLKTFDLIWIEKELFPWLPVIEELAFSVIGKPYVVDYDDAIFHIYDSHKFSMIRSFLGRKIDKIMREATAVIVGNEYLASRANNAGARCVEVLPTVVDTKR